MKIAVQKTILLSFLAVSSVVAAEEQSTNTPSGPPDVDKVSYALGMNLGAMERASKNPSRTDIESFLRGISDVLDDRQTDIKQSEISSVLERANADAAPSEADRKKISYAAGMRMGLQIQYRFTDAKSAQVAQGFYDAVADKPTKVNVSEVTPLLKQAMEWGHMKQAEKNKIEGEAFQARFSKEAGVKTLAEGVQYRVLKDGAGPIPSTNDQVIIKIRGRTPNGKLFIKHNHYLTRCGGGCKGWQEALPHMKIGSRWEVVIPPSMGFGERGEPGWSVGPNMTMIWTFEMVSMAPPNPEFGRGRLGHAFEDSDIPDTPEDAAADAAEVSALFAKK